MSIVSRGNSNDHLYRSTRRNPCLFIHSDGKSKGFGFVTFDTLEDAQKAVQTMNGKKILGRPMAVDWSLPKNVYEQMHKNGLY